MQVSERTAPAYADFGVVDVEERTAPSAGVRRYLAELISRARIDQDLLAGLANSLGWHEAAAKIVAGQLPSLTSVQRGDFGEVLSVALLEQFHGYRVPVSKLRSKVSGNQTLPSTDALALRLNEAGVVVEACFVESKLRTHPDNHAAIEAHDQLRSDYDSELPAILMFVASRLGEASDVLFEPFLVYLRDRTGRADFDTFRIALFYDSASWSERVLANLRDNGVGLEPLTVHVAQIRELAGLVDGLFADLGVQVSSDGD